MKHLRRIFAAVVALAGTMLALATAPAAMAAAILAVLLDRALAARKAHAATA